MFQGYVKLHRKLLDNALWKSEPFTKGQAWVDLIMLANHKESLLNIRGIMVSIKRGQIGYSELKLAARWHWSRGKVRRFLKWLKTEHQIGQQKSNVTSLINLINYNVYQSNDTTDDTADGHQTDTKRYPNKNDKNVKNEKKEDTPIPYKEIINHLNEKTGKKFKHASKETRRHIKARWDSGFCLKDFLTVIDKKCKKWIGDERMVDFLRPETLFGVKFESYLNEIEAQEGKESWRMTENQL